MKDNNQPKKRGGFRPGGGLKPIVPGQPRSILMRVTEVEKRLILKARIDAIAAELNNYR